MSNETKILSKIEKLLRLAKSSNQHEAEAAMEAAIRLSTLHDIDMSRVSGEEAQITKKSLDVGQRLPITFTYTNALVSKYFKVKFVLGGGRNNGRVLHIIGTPEDIENAEYILSFLNSTFMRLWQEYYANHSWLSVQTARKCFFLGLYRGLNDKLAAAQKQTVESTLDAKEQVSYQLVVVDYKEKLDSAITEIFGKTRTAAKSQAKYYDQNSMTAGYQKGQTIQIHAGLKN